MTHEMILVALLPKDRFKGSIMTIKSDDTAKLESNAAIVKAYWAANISILIKLLSIWFIVSFGAGIIFVEELNSFTFMGFPLGFWFAQQGSIYVFVILIFIYASHMHKLEKMFGISDDDEVDSYDLDNGGAS